MELKCNDIHITFEYGRGLNISAHIESDVSRSALDDFVRSVKDGFAKIQLSKWKDHRSLSANAYFHVLVGKIATAMRLGEEEVKASLVRDYGAQMRNDDGSPVGLKLPQGTAPEKLGVKYVKWFDTREENGKLFDCFIVYEETHNYDTAQMSRLIEGAIRQAKDLNIEVLTPADLERMMAEWKH